MRIWGPNCALYFPLLIPRLLTLTGSLYDPKQVFKSFCLSFSSVS